MPTVEDRVEDEPALIKAATALRESKSLLSMEEAQSQLARKSCELKLPKPETQALTGRQICERAREAYVRVGWHYLCRKCNKWHLNLAGGCYITADGVVATAYHVVQTNRDMREGFLVVATEGGKILPVTEVLAGNKSGDTCLLRVKIAAPVKPLPLNTNVYPGDSVWCYSDPLDHSGYFSAGIINRFLGVHDSNKIQTRMDVSTDWAPGSSGSAVLDVCGNVVGLVSEIEVESRPMETGNNRPRGGRRMEPLITFHHAARAAEVLALVKPAKGK